MKIAIFSLPDIPLGKHGIKDSRLDQVYTVAKSKKKTYCEVQLTGEEAAQDAQAIIVSRDGRTDLILKDLEFVETRLSRAEQEEEKTLLEKLKGALEKEIFVAQAGLSAEENKAISGYSLLTCLPVTVAEKEAASALDILLARAVQESGFISFFTAGEKETRAWLITKGTTAWEAAGCIHSDIQRGFIRAEIISFADFIQAGGESQAKQAGKMRLESKDYVMQDADLTNFRFNK